jgi:ATP-dependent DNA ligase
VALGYRSRASVASPHRQRHITTDATEEVKLDGYRAMGVKGRETILYSRNGKNFNKRFPQIAKALGDLPCRHR